MATYRTHGDGSFRPEEFRRLGRNVVFERGALVFHAENISVGENVYVGHYAILKGYYKNEMHIGNNVWIGQQCFLHSAGGLVIGDNVGIGPGARVTTARHRDVGHGTPLSHSELEFAAVFIEDDCNIGINATILPGVHLGRGAQVGAGAVVVEDVEAYSLVVGVPARKLRQRADNPQ